MSFVRHRKIEDILKQWKLECKLKRPIYYWYNRITGELTICSSEVGLLIGVYGSLVDKYKQILKESIRNFKEVRFQEINYHWI